MNSDFTIRQAVQTDTASIFTLIKALAEYENLSHQVTGTVEQLESHLFGDRCLDARSLAPDSDAGSHRPYAEALVIEVESKIVGFALFFSNYSTFLTKPGIYLEDLFVLPEYRRQGMGRAMLTYLGKLAFERDAGRLEWSVLDWNESAIAFYQEMGATILPDWRTCRVTGEALANLANK